MNGEENGQAALAVWDARSKEWWVPQRFARMDWLRSNGFPLDSMTRLEFYPGRVRVFTFTRNPDGKVMVGPNRQPVIEVTDRPIAELPPQEIL